MALPVYLQQFKAAGIYRVVYDQSTVRGVEAETLRLVVGYSEQGPFNIPTYVKSVSEFKALYGNINKNLERRGVFFHRLAIQALAAGPILCLNLKKFDNEQVQYCPIGSGTDAANNPLATPGVENAAVTSIYDTSGFWELSEENVAALSETKKNYINICAADTIKNSNTFFIRKAIDSNVKGYDITVSDWYSDESEIPEFLKKHLDAKISDFIAEVYVFGGQFTKGQISASSVLGKYFDDKAESPTLRPEVTDAWGDKQDTLEMLYREDTAKPIGHYVGSLIPEFKDKNGNYMALNIVFNQDENVHNMIMSFNTDLLYNTQDSATEDENSRTPNKARMKAAGVIGGNNATDTFSLVDLSKLRVMKLEPGIPTNITAEDAEKINAVLKDAVKGKTLSADKALSTEDAIAYNSRLKGAVKDTLTAEQAVIYNSRLEGAVKDTLTAEQAVIYNSRLEGAIKANVETTFTTEQLAKYNEAIKDLGGSSSAEPASKAKSASETGTQETTKITPDEAHAAAYNATLPGAKVEGNNVTPEEAAAYNAALPGAKVEGNNVTPEEAAAYNAALTGAKTEGNNVTPEEAETYNAALAGVISSGNDVKPTEAQANAYNNVVLPTILPMPKPVYLKGYTYTTKPVTNLKEKIDWHKSILKTLTEYKGLRRALLNKSNIDFRYIVDTFEAYPETGTSSDDAEQDTTKSMLSYLAKQKESALAILNFPSVRNFVKYGETYLTNNIFDINKVVKLYKLPSNAEGASFCAFYTPVKFTDGYIDTIVPSAGLVSNLFMQKYASRQPYYIIAGPNYGLISSNGLVGPDYNYSNDELQIIEPFGVNCMIYRPGFGTFINANQTAKQTPVSALSKVHVRELVIYLQDEIEKVLQSYQWEFNNTTTRNAILDKANQICARVAANGGIQAYLNVMDESNNTPDVIDNEMAILSTHIEPGRGCGKMIQELTIYRTGELSSTITE